MKSSGAEAEVEVEVESKDLCNLANYGGHKMFEFCEKMPVVSVELGEMISKNNQFKITIPVSPDVNDLSNLLIKPHTCAFLENENSDNYFYGIKHLDVIDDIIFNLYNYQNIYKLPGKLINGVWRLTSGLLPLTHLLEYSNQIKLEIEVKLNTQKKRFYNFTALYVTVNEPTERMVFSLPTCDGKYAVEFIGKIWRVNHLNKDEPSLL